MTEHPESSANVPPLAPPAGSPPYPYAYPPSPPGGPASAGAPGTYPGGYPPPPMPYGTYPGSPPGPTGPRNGMGVAALVVAIIALVASCSIAGGLVLGVVAVILGFVGRARVKRGEADNGGVALTGIVLGFVAIVVSLAFIALYVGFFNKYGGQELVDCLQSAGQDNDRAQQCFNDFEQTMRSQMSQTGTPGR